jgi:hypothetical protein
VASFHGQIADGTNLQLMSSSHFRDELEANVDVLDNWITSFALVFEHLFPGSFAFAAAAQ